jgi:hypothetical protein
MTKSMSKSESESESEKLQVAPHDLAHTLTLNPTRRLNLELL